MKNLKFSQINFKSAFFLRRFNNSYNCLDLQLELIFHFESVICPWLDKNRNRTLYIQKSCCGFLLFEAHILQVYFLYQFVPYVIWHERFFPPLCVLLPEFFTVT